MPNFNPIVCSISSIAVRTGFLTATLINDIKFEFYKILYVILVRFFHSKWKKVLLTATNNSRLILSTVAKGIFKEIKDLTQCFIFLILFRKVKRIFELSTFTLFHMNIQVVIRRIYWEGKIYAVNPNASQQCNNRRHKKQPAGYKCMFR